MVLCPNISNKTVAKQFNEMKDAIGEVAAYDVWSKNNGNSIDKAPNGEPSILFESLLKAFDGDRVLAMKAKSRMYSKDFISRFGDWISQPEKFQKRMDKNGEPIFTQKSLKKDVKTGKYSELFKPFDATKILGKTIVDQLESGKQVSSSEILNKLIDINVFFNENVLLADILSKHDIPVVYGNTDSGVLASTVYSPKKGSFIVINKDIAKNISADFFSTTILHEVIHAVSRNVIESPKNLEEVALNKANKKLYDKFSKIFPEDSYSRINYEDGFYILNSEEDFLSVFITDPSARGLLFDTAKKLNNKSNKFLGKIKSFINSISKVLFNKNIFTGTKELLLDYQNRLVDYLQNRPKMEKGDIEDKNLLKMLYESVDERTSINDNLAGTFKHLHDYYKYLKKSNIKIIQPVTGPIYTDEQLKNLSAADLREKIINDLQARIASINSSGKTVEQKAAETQILLSLIQRFLANDVSLFRSLCDFTIQSLSYLEPDLNYVKELQNPNGTYKVISSDEYMDLVHDKFGTYYNIFKSISATLQNNAMLNYLQEELTSGNPSVTTYDINTVQQLIMRVNDGKQIAEDGLGVLKHILYNNCADVIKRVANEANDLSAIDYLNELSRGYVSYDTSSFFTTLGSIDGAKDNGLRTILHLVTSALAKADDNIAPVVERLIDLFYAAKKAGINVKDIYEHVNGKTTQNIVLPFNKGLHDLNYRKFILSLNAHFGLPEDNMSAPEDEVLKKEWNRAVNDWHRHNSIRKYKPEYYDKFIDISSFTTEARSAILIEIDEIKLHAIDKEKYNDNYYHYDLLTKEQRDRLEYLNMRMQILKSDEDINGNLKEPGSIAYMIAKELLELDRKLRESGEIEYDVEAWKRDRRHFIDTHGGYEAYINGDESFDWEALDEWDTFNSKERLKTDDSGESLLFKQIDEELGQYIIYEDNGDGGARYERNRELIRQKKRPYYNKFTGEIDPSLMPTVIKKLIKQLEDENYKIKSRATRGSKNILLKKLSKQRKRLLRKYAMFSRTTAFTQGLDEARRSGAEDAVLLYLRNNGTGDVTGDNYRPYSIFTKIVVRPEYRERFVEFGPGEGYIKRDSNLDPRFKQYEHFGIHAIPYGKVYDNTKAYNKVKDSDLYKETLKVIKDINDLYKIKYPNLYRLPGITAGVAKRLRGDIDNPNTSAVGKVWKKLQIVGNTILDEIGFSEEEVRQDKQMQRSLEDLLNDDPFVKQLNLSKIVGVMPDGRQLNMVPRHFISKLDDPSHLSYDLIGILSETYRQAQRFSELQKIKNDCEMLYDMFSKREYRIDKGVDKNGEKKIKKLVPADTNTVRAARNFLDMNLYGVRQQRVQVKNMNITKLANVIKRYAIALNLGMKPSVAIVGMLTSECASLVHSMVGIRYGQEEYWKGLEEVMLLSIASLREGTSIAKANSSNKMTLLGEMFNLAETVEKKYKFNNRGRVLKGVSLNYTFGFMSLFDFFAKSHIMVSTLMSYRYFGGRFISLEDLRNSTAYYKMSEKQFNREVASKFKTCVSAYEILSVRNKKIHIDEKYEDAFKLAYDVIKQRIINYAENADGMATETQKAMITANIWGGMVMMHRQYLPITLQSYFGNAVYNQNTQQMVGAQFRSIYDIYKIMFHGLRRGWNKESRSKNMYSMMAKTTALGAVSGLLFAAPIIGTPVGLIAGSMLGLFGGFTSSKALDEYLNDSSSLQAAQLSRYRRKMLKKTTIEVALYKTLVSNLSFLFAYLFHALGGDIDDDESWWTRIYWLMLYCLDKLAWEYFNAYRFDDMANTIKSPSAVETGADAVQQGAKSLADLALNIVNPRVNLLDTFRDESLSDINEYSDPEDDIVTRGAYKYEIPVFGGNFTKRQKSWIKRTPVKNLWEELYGSKDKDRYFRHQIMGIKDGEDLRDTFEYE